MNYYSFIKDEIDDFTIVYEFVTVGDTLYTVSFSKTEYDVFLYAHPTLLHKGYSISIFRSGKKERDDLVLLTIIKIVLDFLAGDNLDAVLLYHCDTSDNKQTAMDKLFDAWCNHALVMNSIWKHSVQVEVPQLNGTKIDNFLGCIALTNHPELDQIQEQFQEFAIYLLDISNSEHKDY